MLPSYPKVWQLGHRQALDIFSPPGPVFVQEKLDGSQITFGLNDEGKLEIRSKSVQQNLDAPDKMFTRAVENLLARESILIPGLVYRGEYLRQRKHNVIEYDRVPVGNISIFDIEDTATGTFFSMQELHIEAIRVELDSAWVLDSSTSTISHAQLAEYLQNVSKLGGAQIEGVVMKNYSQLTGFGQPVFCKFVSEQYKEAHKSTHKTHNNKDYMTMLGAKYFSEARFQKAVIHLTERDELDHEPSDISKIFAEVAKDFEEEWASEVKEDLWAHYRKPLLKLVQRGIPEWYKAKLAADVLEEK